MTENISITEVPSTREHSPKQGMTVKVMKGSFWVLVGQVLPLIATFIATPFVIRSLGSESYGVLILVGLISSYFSYADFGMALASTKFAAEAYAEKSPQREGMVVRTATVISFLSAILIGIPLFIFSYWIVSDLLNVPVAIRSQASIALKVTSVAFVVSILGTVFNSPQLSRMRMDLNVLITAGTKVLMILITPVVLYFGGGIVDACIVAFVAALLITLGNLFVSGRLLPSMYHWSIDKDMIRPLLRFGGSVAIYGIAITVLGYMEKFLLARLVSVKFLAYYSVAFTFSNMTTMFSLAMVQTLIPAFSQLLAPNKKNELKSLFSRTLRISMIGLLPSIMFLVVVAKPFFTIWAGKEFGTESVMPFYILLAGVFFSIVVYVPNCLLIASGRTDLYAKVYWIEILPYAALTYLLIDKYGIIGAAVSWSIKEILNCFIFIRYLKKYTRVSFDILDELSHFALGVVVLAPPILFALLYNNFSLWLAAFVPLFILFYGWLVWKRLVKEDERIWIRQKLNSILKRRSAV